VCFVAPKFLNPFRPGGCAAPYIQLADFLRQSGHDVTLLDTAESATAGDSEAANWIARYRQRGIRYVPLPESPYNLYSVSNCLAVSYRVYHWLRHQGEFDVIHFPARGGVGFYAVVAKHQGLALRRTTTVVGLHGTSSWNRIADGQVLALEQELERDFIERRSAELADMVWSPCRSMLDWAAAQGWAISGETCVRGYGALGVEGFSRTDVGERHPVREIVFFGRQKERKGLALFLDAIDHLCGMLESPERATLAVTVLGRPALINGDDSLKIIRARARKWPFRTQVFPNVNRAQALKYLMAKGRLAVIPSLYDKYPDAVLECLACSIPFLASRVGGIPEQIAAESRERVCFDPQPKILADRLRLAIDEGHAPAEPACDPASNAADWIRWHQQYSRERQSHDAASTGSDRGPGPTVSVCITHFNRPHYLRQALTSIAGQRQSPLEVIVVDDGSPGESVQRELDDIIREFDFAGRGWRLIRQENRYLGAARNRAASEAAGEYLLFMDDDNIAKPDEIATFAAVVSRTGADVITCLFDSFEADRDPAIPGESDRRWLFTGANFPLCALQNTFGDANALISRRAWQEIGGFTEDYGVGHEDWEMFSRLTLRGYRLEIIPESLFHYRTSPTSMLRTSSARKNLLRSLRPHMEYLPRAYQPLVEMAVGLSLLRWESSLTPPIAPPATDVPLRYRIVDALNLRLKKIGMIHYVAKGLAKRVLQLRRLLSGVAIASPVDDARSWQPRKRKAEIVPEHVSLSKPHVARPHVMAKVARSRNSSET
jgi:glycosyltransferase involved in cell wall biosynthesis